MNEKKNIRNKNEVSKGAWVRDIALGLKLRSRAVPVPNYPKVWGLTQLLAFGSLSFIPISVATTLKILRLASLQALPAVKGRRYTLSPPPSINLMFFPRILRAVADPYSLPPAACISMSAAAAGIAHP